MSMKVVPTAAVLGAEIAGVDLSRPLDDPTFAAIERAYNEYGVIFFRGQSITPAQQVVFTRRFGEIEFNIFGERWSVPGNPEIVVLSNITEGGRPTGVRRAGERWHSDMCYTARPPRGTVLHALEVPELHGLSLGDTEFASAAAAWDALPDAMKRALEGRQAVFDFRGRQRALTPTQEEIDRNPPVRHPIVRTHPPTGRKCLYVMRDDCTGIEGMESDEAEALIAALADHIVKPALTLNLKSPRGLEIVRSLLKKADVTVENMAPGTIERLGLGYDAVKEINPGIIYCQVKGFGTGSPYENSLAFDMIAQAAGGPISVTGEGDRAPVKPGPSFGDTGTGMLMAVSILGALYQRTKTGKGRRLQVAMQDAMIHYMRVPFSRTQQSGQAPVRNGSSRSNPALAPSALYPCKGGGPNDYAYIFTSRANPDHWRRLLKAIEREDLIDDARYDTGPARGQRAAEVDELIAAWTREHSKEEVMKVIGDAGVPAGAVFDTLELMNDPSLAERGIMQTIQHPTTGAVKMPAWPVRFDGAPPRVKPSPLLGEHNAEVLSGWLGMSPQEIEALCKDGIV